MAWFKSSASIARLGVLLLHFTRALVFWRRRQRHDPAIDPAVMSRETAIAIRPVVHCYLVVVAAYYVISALFYRVPGDPGWDPAAAAVSSVICLLLFRYTYATQSMQRLEIAGHVTNVLILANCALDIWLKYDALKLIYFALLLPIFAISGARMRVMLPCTIACIFAICFLTSQHEPEQFGDYMWIAFTALVTALGMSSAMRMTVMRSVRARITADRHRDEARTLANFDALTSLPNRRNFFSTLDDLLATGRRFDLGLIDLDGFKPINDIYGHGAGDAVLIEAGRRLAAICAGRGVVARLGGDEFVLILHDQACEQVSDGDLKALGEQFCDALSEPFPLGSATLSLSGSVGLVRHIPGLTDKLNGSQLLERADYALYYAKENRRGAAVVFDRQHESDMHKFGRVTHALRSSQLDDEMCLAFQPQYDLVGKRTVGFEALARWNSPLLGNVPPDVFIRAAEHSGLINEITPALLKKALTAAADWPEDMRLAFNLSARDLHSPRTVARICEAVRLSGIAPRRIEFEITETAMLNDFDQALASLGELKAMGARIALDDFGAGYSSFSYIHRLPVDVIKIDQSFVAELLKNVQARKLVKTMIDLCSNLNLEHVIEGVETEEQLRQLLEVQARYVQGYLFARPMMADEVLPYLERETKVVQLHTRSMGM